jgi:hypothetical protein
MRVWQAICLGAVASFLGCECFVAPGSLDGGLPISDSGGSDAGAEPGPDSGADGSVPSNDGGLESGTDSGVSSDAGSFDAGNVDAGPPQDAGTSDSGCIITAGYTATRVYPPGIVPSGNWSWVSTTPVLTATAGSWDYAGVQEPSVMMTGSTFVMWYAGRDATGWRIGRATSSDGVAWTKDPSPVLDLGAEWDGASISGPAVVLVNGT